MCMSKSTKLYPQLVVSKQLNNNNNINKDIKEARRVRFASEVNIHEIENIESWSNEEVQSSWWTNDDYQTFRQTSKTTLEVANGKEGLLYNDTNEFCLRGLEHRTALCKGQREESVGKIWHIVMNSQYRNCDSNQIAQLSQQVSSQSVHSAHLQGLKDAVVMQQENSKEIVQMRIANRRARTMKSLPSSSSSVEPRKIKSTQTETIITPCIAARQA